MVSIACKGLLRADGYEPSRSGEKCEGDQHASKDFSHVPSSFEDSRSLPCRRRCYMSRR